MTRTLRGRRALATKWEDASALAFRPRSDHRANAAAYLRRHRDDDRQHAEDLLDEALDESFPASDPPSVGRAN